MKFTHTILVIITIWNLDVGAIKESLGEDSDEIIKYTEDTRDFLQNNKIEGLEISNKLKNLLSKYNYKSNGQPKKIENVALALQGFKEHFNIKFDTDVTNINPPKVIKTQSIALDKIIKEIEKMLVMNPTNVNISALMDIIFKPFLILNIKNRKKCCIETMRHVMKMIEQHYTTYLDNISTCELNSNESISAIGIDASDYFLGEYRQNQFKKSYPESFNVGRLFGPIKNHGSSLTEYISRILKNIGAPKKNYKNSTFPTLSVCTKIYIQDFLEFIKMVLQRKLRVLMFACDKSLHSRRNSVCALLNIRNHEHNEPRINLRSPKTILDLLIQANKLTNLGASLAYKNIINLTNQLKTAKLMSELIKSNKQNLLSVMFKDIKWLNTRLNEAVYYYNRIKYLRQLVLAEWYEPRDN